LLRQSQRAHSWLHSWLQSSTKIGQRLLKEIYRNAHSQQGALPLSVARTKLCGWQHSSLRRKAQEYSLEVENKNPQWFHVEELPERV
jgi:hypothetical protein